MIKIELFEQLGDEPPTVKFINSDGSQLNIDVLNIEKTIRGYLIEVEGLQPKKGRRGTPNGS